MTQRKIAKDWKEVFQIEHKPPIPHAFIQWKGTDVCMDYFCICGSAYHYDGDFAYQVQCDECGRVYGVGSHVELIEIIDKNIEFIKTGECWKGKDEPLKHDEFLSKLNTKIVAEATNKEITLDVMFNEESIPPIYLAFPDGTTFKITNYKVEEVTEDGTIQD